VTFTVITIGPRATGLAVGFRRRDIKLLVVAANDVASLKRSQCGSALVLVDDELRDGDEPRDVAEWLAAEGIVAFIAAVHERPVPNGTAWDDAARLNCVTQTPVVWPIDGTAEAIFDLLQSYASALAGCGNYIGLNVNDLAAISTSPCVGMFGRWNVGGTPTEFMQRFGLRWGAPPRAAFLTVRGGRGATLTGTQEVVTSVQALFSPDDDFLFTTNVHDGDELPDEALLTVFCGPRKRVAPQGP
jgi:hypothetical protein